MTTPDTTRNMTPDRLDEVLAAYGAAPSRWPEEEREAAEGLIARSAPARAALAEAAHLDRLLDAAPPPPATDALAARLRDLMPAPAEATVLPFVPRPAASRRPWHATGFARAAVVALALVGGVGIGLAMPEFGGTNPTVPQETVADAESDGGTSVAAQDAANDTALAGFDTANSFDGSTPAAASGTPVLASLMSDGDPGFATVSYVEDASDTEGLALAALPLQ